VVRDRRLYLPAFAIYHAMARVEIRWKEQGTHEDLTAFSGSIEEAKGVDIATAIEIVFKSWLENRIRGRSVVVTDLELYLDGEFLRLTREEENAYLIRINEASGK